MYAKAHASSRHEEWDHYVPNLELVRCGERVEPALFFKIGGADYDDWATAVEPVTIGWNWYRTKGDAPYVVIDLHVLFANRNGTSIGTGAAGQATVWTSAAYEYSHQLRSRTLLDPGDPGQREAIEAWASAPAPVMLYFVEEQLRATSYVSMNLAAESRQDLLRVLAEASRELDREGVVPGSFSDACALLKNALPRLSWWEES